MTRAQKAAVEDAKRIAGKFPQIEQQVLRPALEMCIIRALLTARDHAARECWKIAGAQAQDCRRRADMLGQAASARIQARIYDRFKLHRDTA